MQRLKWLKIICFLNVTFLAIIIIFSDEMSKTTSFLPFVVNSTTARFIYISFRYERINQLLASYSHRYEHSLDECDTTKPLSDRDKIAFDIISIKLLTLRSEIIPYPNEYFHGRGIVLTTGRSQIKYARVNLKMLEATGTRLPVQIWYSSFQIPHEQMISLLLVAPSLNASVCCFLSAECRTLTQVWKMNTTYIYKPPSNFIRSRFFPYKPAAIVSSTFSEVLFLDCDAYVTRDPEELFLSDPMYLQFGALFYPDALKSRQHPAVWKLFNTSCAQDEYEFDSAMILVDKKRVWNGLYMTKLMNDHYQTFYKHVTDGDKDTFRLAFRYMQVKYYLVMTPCATGSFNGTHFCGYSLCKTDSLSQHIYVNHVHLFKHESVKYSPNSLGYTRIGLGDPNNNTFYFRHCKLKNAKTSCFHILKEPNEQIMQGNCYNGATTLEEIEDYEYKWNEPLINEKSKNNRVLMSRTNNFMPNFIDNLIEYSKSTVIQRTEDDLNMIHSMSAPFSTLINSSILNFRNLAQTKIN